MVITVKKGELSKEMLPTLMTFGVTLDMSLVLVPSQHHTAVLVGLPHLIHDDVSGGETGIVAGVHLWPGWGHDMHVSRSLALRGVVSFGGFYHDHPLIPVPLLGEEPEESFKEFGWGFVREKLAYF